METGLDPNTTSLLATGVYGITNSVSPLSISLRTAYGRAAKKPGKRRVSGLTSSGWDLPPVEGTDSLVRQCLQVFTLPAVFFVDRVGHRMILLAGAVG